MGWNLISSYIDPSNPAMPDVFAPVLPDLLLVKNGRGQVFWPNYHINQIGNWNVLDGYQVYMTAARTLVITGTQVAPEATPINLTTGWAMVSYLRATPMPVQTALSTLSGSLMLAKDGAGKVYWPQYGINQIGNMLPGKGYQLYLTSAATLTYPANSGLGPIEQESAPEPIVHFIGCASNTGANATALLTADLLAGLQLQPGDELAVFGAQSGLCASALSWEGSSDALALTAWGDDEVTEAVDGLQEGEAMLWMIWHTSGNRESVLRIAYRQEDPFQGDGLYTQDGLYLLQAAPQYQLFLPALRR
jgi:hypothetical protein